jgi:chromosome partitioning protein
VKTVAVTAFKGGAGKSTLTVNLAVCAHLHGLSAIILDLDPQGTSEAWGDLREIEGPEVVGAKAGNLAKHLKSAEAQSFDIALIDTPPSDTREARLGVRHSDLVLIPARPDLWDLLAIESTWAMTQEERKPSWVVLNGVSPIVSGAVADAEATIAEAGMELAPQRVHNRIAFTYAKTDGRSVLEYEPEGKAAEEIRELFYWMCRKLDLRVRRRRAA